MINKHPHNPLPYKCLSIFSPLKSLNKNNILPSAFLIFLFFIFNRAQADNYLGIPHQQDPDLVVCVLPTQWENGPNIKYTLKFNGWIRVIAHTNLISGNKNDGYFLSTTNPDTSSSDQLHVYYKGTSPVPICFSLSSNGMPDSLLLQVDRNKSYLSTDSMISAIFSDHDVFCREFRKYRRIEIITFNHNQTIRYSVLISRHHLRPMQPIRDKNINQKTVSYIHSIEHTHWPTVLELNSKLNQTCLLGITPTLFRYLYLSNGITETSAIQLTDAIGVASNFIKDLSEKKHNQPNTNRKELIKKNKKCKDDFADSIDTRLTEWENICFTEISQILANKAFQSLEKPKVNPYSRKLTEISSIESQESQKILTQENGSSLFQAIAESYSKQLPFSNRISEEDIRITVCQITHEIWQLQLKEDMDKFNRANGFNLSPQELFPTYLKELQDLTGFSPEELREISPHLPSTIEIEPGLLPLIQKVVDAPIHIYSKGSYNIEVFDDDLWAEKAPHLNQFLKHRNESVRLTLFPPLSKSSTVALWQDFSKDNSCRYFCLTNHSFCNRKEGPKD